MYYNIDDILCEDHQVECRLEVDLYKGVFLDQEIQTEDGNLHKGHQLKLPFWVAKILSELESEGSQIVSVEILEMFEDDNQKTLETQPGIKYVNLRQYSPYFYHLGFKMAEMIPNDIRIERFSGAIQLRETLIESLKKRSIQIIFQMVQAKQEDITTLTDDEKENFYISRNIQLEYERWEQRLTKRQKNDAPNKKLKQL